jgi:hypothetical protein
MIAPYITTLEQFNPELCNDFPCGIMPLLLATGFSTLKLPWDFAFWTQVSTGPLTHTWHNLGLDWIGPLCCVWVESLILHIPRPWMTWRGDVLSAMGGALVGKEAVSRLDDWFCCLHLTHVVLSPTLLPGHIQADLWRIIVVFNVSFFSQSPSFFSHFPYASWIMRISFYVYFSYFYDMASWGAAQIGEINGQDWFL